MYNLHCHSLLSDGALLPSEVAVRYAALGYKIIAITDHTDYSNIETNIKAILDFCQHWPKNSKIKVSPGIELTHLPLEQFEPLVKYSRKQGIKIIVGHGETLTEPVIPGTNRAILETDIDLLAHPGLITPEDARLAKKRGIFLEVTSRAGHCQTNAHVIEQALKTGARLILSTDSHAPLDIIRPDELIQFGLKSGLSPQEIDGIYQDVGCWIKEKVK